MRVFARIAALLIVIAAALVGPFPLKLAQPGREEPAANRGLARVRERGMIRLATVRGSGAYFLHRGRPAGLEFDLVSRLGGELGVETDPHPVASAAEATRLLLDGEVDLAVVAPDHPRVEGAIRVIREGASSETRQVLASRGAADLVSALQDVFYRSRFDGFARILEQRYARIARANPADEDQGISRWDELIARHAAAEGVDWRLVAAVISEESSFDESAVSPRGATGLMQIMPAVGEDLEVDDLSDPDRNVLTGIRYLRRLFKIFAGRDGEGNLPLVLAAYLLGPGHVFDARELAREKGLDPERWRKGVRRMLPLLEKPEVYERLQFGYAQGGLAVRYVDRVLHRYEIYKRHALEPGPEPETTAIVKDGSAGKDEDEAKPPPRTAVADTDHASM